MAAYRIHRIYRRITDKQRRLNQQLRNPSMRIATQTFSKCMRSSHMRLQCPQQARFYDPFPQLADAENLALIATRHFSPALCSALQKTFTKMFGHDYRLTKVQAELLPQLFDINLGQYNEDVQKPSTSSEIETDGPCRRSRDSMVDVLIQGRTGSGKTMMFLLKALQILEDNEQSASGFPPVVGVKVLIITPTRELSTQIFREAKFLVTDLPRRPNVACLVEGTPRESDIKMFQRSCPDILISSIGRLTLHCTATPQFPEVFGPLKLVILDEADRLVNYVGRLELERALQKIEFNRRISHVFVSATISRDVYEFRRRVTMNQQFSQASDPLPQIEQRYSVCEPETLCSSLYSVLRSEIENRPHDYKVIVFFPTTSVTVFATQFFQDRLKLPPLSSVHTRKHPTLRNAVFESLRRAPTGILFACNSASRGMDVPSITLVVHVGAPDSSDGYIHRTGRTGRVHNTGRSLLLLTPSEKAVLKELSTFTELQVSDEDVAECRIKTNKGPHRANLIFAARRAYSSLLSHYAARHEALSLTPQEVVDLANKWMEAFGMKTPPTVNYGIVEALDLYDCHNLRIEEDAQ